MTILSYVERLALADAQARRAGLLAILQELIAPSGDEASFEAVGIPNLALSMMPQDDVPALLAAVPALRQRRPGVAMPALAETIHNGPRDTTAVIEEAAMQTVLE